MNNSLKAFVAKNFNLVIPDQEIKKPALQLTKEILELLEYGILIEPKALYYLNDTTISTIKLQIGVNFKNANSSFYASFKEMDSYHDLELRIHQIFHYLTAASPIHLPFTPNQDVKDLDTSLKSLTTIKLGTKEELDERVKKILTSGLALPSDHIPFYYELYKGLNLALDKIQNRELLITIANKDLVPLEDFDLFMAQINQILLNSTSFIKSNETYGRLEQAEKEQLQHISTLMGAAKGANRLNEYAKHVRRHKKYLLILRKVAKKHNEDGSFDALVQTINYLLRRNKEVNVKKLQPLSQEVSNPHFVFDDFADYIKEANVYTLIRYHNLLSEKIIKNLTNEFSDYYRIRNNKLFIKETAPKLLDHQEANTLVRRLDLVVLELRTRYQGRFDKTVFLLDQEEDLEVHLALPTSSKNFIGNIPENSYLIVNRDLQVGAYWEGRPHEHIDMDLHYVDLDGHHIGWNGAYNQNGVRYSGDMTSTNKDGFAAEYIYVPGQLKGDIDISLSGYYLDDDTPYTLVIGTADLDRDQMLSPETTIFTNKTVLKESENQPLFNIYAKENCNLFVFAKGSTETGRTFDSNLKEIYIKAKERKLATSLHLDVFVDDILGSTIIYDEKDIPQGFEVKDFRINNLSQDSFVDLLEA